MRLPDFIEANIESILTEWESFARSIWPGSSDLPPEELRDHAELILQAVVRDMRTTQSGPEQSQKSQGHGALSDHSEQLDDASNRHGAERVDSGFQLREVVSEYRALRASVLRLWRESLPTADQNDLADITRFNESIDQSLTRAIQSFTDRIDQSRRLFLAILGHDLRNPVVAIKLSANVLGSRGQLAAEAALLAKNILSSAVAMERMVRDLLDFTASGFGGQMPVTKETVELRPICDEVVNEIRAGHPQNGVQVEYEGGTLCSCDPARIRQAIGNLLGNAVQHGSPEYPVKVRVASKSGQVMIAINNHGTPIPQAAIPMLFDPLRRSSSGMLPNRTTKGIGLGLFIANQIIMAHGGTIAVTSSELEGTTFTATLPTAR